MSKRVLIVEDDASIGLLIEAVLRLEGYASTVVAEGRRALDVLRAGTFDIVILDVMLPGMDGISILKAIREEHDFNQIPVVMLSAKKDDDTTWAGWRAGCNYYMTKPFEPSELVTILKQLQPVS